MTVLNSDDPDWFWVSKFDGHEGFVPSGFIYPLDAIQRQRKFTSFLSKFLRSNRILLPISFLESNIFPRRGHPIH